MNEIENEIFKIKSGDHQAFGVFVDNYRQTIFNFIYKMIFDYQQALDLTQETFIKVFLNRNKIDPKKKILSWMYKISYNLTIDFIRKKKAIPVDFALAEKLYVNNSQEPYEILNKKENIQNVRKILGKMPEMYAQILSLRELQGLNCYEISEIISVNYSTVRWRIFQARKLFKELWLKEYEYDTNPSI